MLHFIIYYVSAIYLLQLFFIYYNIYVRFIYVDNFIKIDYANLTENQTLIYLYYYE